MTEDLKYMNVREIREKKEEKLELVQLSYYPNGLVPVMSNATLKYHYNVLARGYVDRFNTQTEDANFNKQGAILHNIFFPQLQPYKKTNDPYGPIAELIDQKFNSYANFKEKFTQQAMKIQGSGWIFLNVQAKIEVIEDHSISGNPNRILLLVDWWEHAWALDYQADKYKYLTNHWLITNWNIINQRFLLG